MLTQGTPGVLVNEGFEQIHKEQESRGDGEDNENTKGEGKCVLLM